MKKKHLLRRIESLEKRYATEEEKALLNPKKELEVVRWYKVDDLRSGCLGFNGFGTIIDDIEVSSGLCNGDFMTICIQQVNGKKWRINKDATFKEATQQEVEEALIKESKRRGYKVGVKFKSFLYDKGEVILSSSKLDWEEVGDKGWHLRDSYGYSIFHNGVWAEIIEVDKPKKGDVVKAWMKDPEMYVIGIYSHYREGLGYCVSGEYRYNAKVVTTEEVTELLFKK